MRGIPRGIVNVLFRSRTLQIFNNCYNNVKGWLNSKGTLYHSINTFLQYAMLQKVEPTLSVKNYIHLFSGFVLL